LTLEISIACEELDETTEIDLLIQCVKAILEPRLVASADANVDETEDESDNGNSGSENDTEIEENDAEADDPDAETTLDVGQSKLRAFYDFINNPVELAAWLETETHRYKEVCDKPTKTTKEQEFIQYTPEARLKYALISLLRPAMIVDGQHRINGAYESPTEIQFTVCAIRDADWVEQVFQFVVLNKLAKPISKDFLTALLNTSLTNKEVHDIEKRLETVGIANEERKLMKYLNFDPLSPFYEMIADAGEVAGVENRGKLSSRGMLRLAKRWLSIPKDKKELEMFYPLLNETARKQAREKWRIGADGMQIPMSLFYVFWDAIKEQYKPQGVWEKEPNFNLLYIVTMHVIQDLFLKTKAKADVKYPTIEQFKEDVKNFYTSVPGAFFTKWSATGLQSGDGPSYIQDAIEQLRGGTSLSRLQRNSNLFTS